MPKVSSKAPTTSNNRETVLGALSQAQDTSWKDYPLIGAVVNQNQRGGIYVNAEKDSIWVFILHKSGFGYVTANSKYNSNYSDFLAWIKTEQCLPNYFHLYSSPFTNPETLENLHLSYKLRQRYRYIFNPCNANETPINRHEGFILLDINDIEEQYFETSEIGNIYSNYWENFSDFQTNAIGKFLIDKENKICSACYSAAIYNSHSEVDIVTAEKCRGLGLAKIVTSAFLQQSMEKNIVPYWDCFADNIPSQKLAESAGFSLLNKYNFLSIFDPDKKSENE